MAQTMIKEEPTEIHDKVQDTAGLGTAICRFSLLCGGWSCSDGKEAYGMVQPGCLQAQ